MNSTTTVTIRLYTPSRLKNEHKAHLDLIQRIKNQISQEQETTEVPLFEQLMNES